MSYEITVEHEVKPPSAKAWVQELEHALFALEFDDCPTLYGMLENELRCATHDLKLVLKEEKENETGDEPKNRKDQVNESSIDLQSVR